MDWHKDTTANASKLYPQVGRKGKAHTGSNGKVTLYREKHSKFLKKWRIAFAVRYKRAATDDEARIALDTGTVWEDIARWTSTGMTMVIKHPDDCACDFCKRNPDYCGPYQTVCAGLRASVDKRRVEDAAAAAAREANERSLQTLYRAHNLIGSCPFGDKVFERLASGAVSVEQIADAFSMTPEEIRNFIWAKNYKAS